MTNKQAIEVLQDAMMHTAGFGTMVENRADATLEHAITAVEFEMMFPTKKEAA